MRERSEDKSRLTYLGPTPADIVGGTKDERWVLRAVTLTDVGDGAQTFSLQAESQVVFSLGTPVDEEIYSVRDAFMCVTGADETAHILPHQLRRKENSVNQMASTSTNGKC